MRSLYALLKRRRDAFSDTCGSGTDITPEPGGQMDVPVKEETSASTAVPFRSLADMGTRLSPPSDSTLFCVRLFVSSYSGTQGFVIRHTDSPRPQPQVQQSCMAVRSV